MRRGIYQRFVKRSMDFVLSLIALIVLSPIMLLVSILVKVKLGSPVIFKQQRPGCNEKIFMLYKFRTMTDHKDNNGNLLPDKIRLTKFGRFLRSTSLDELPELLNIVKGDMSIVGPRPLLVQYLPLYSEEEKRRHEVRPGLTGLAQIKGRNALSWEERFRCDIQYIDSICLKNDIIIIIGTIQKVFSKQDIIEPGVMEDFDVYRTKQLQGNNPNIENGQL